MILVIKNVSGGALAEDLINIMINNGVIKRDDLPKPVIAKLENRANLRKVLQADGD